MSLRSILARPFATIFPPKPKMVFPFLWRSEKGLVWLRTNFPREVDILVYEPRKSGDCSYVGAIKKPFPPQYRGTAAVPFRSSEEVWELRLPPGEVVQLENIED